MFTWIENSAKPTRLNVKPKEKIVTPSSSSQTASTSAKTSISSTKQNNVSNKTSKSQLSESPHRDMANWLKTLSRSTTDMDILMIRRRILYGIFLRTIHHLLWMSRHQKSADLQRAIGGKDPNERKTFPRSDPQSEQYYPMELSRSHDRVYWHYLTGSSPSTSSILSSRDTSKKRDTINLSKIILCTALRAPITCETK